MEYTFNVWMTAVKWPSDISLCLNNSAVPKDKDRQCFKLRQGIDKKIVIYVQQTTNKELAIER